MLLRHTDRIVFSFDGDSAGRKAAKRAFEACIPHLADDKEIRFLFLPKEHDPDSFIREFGQDKFNEEIQKAQPLSRFFIDVVSDQIDWSSAEGKAQAQNNAKDYFKKMPAIALRVQILRDFAKRLGASQLELEKFYGLPSTQEVTISKQEPQFEVNSLKISGKSDWKRKSDVRAMENLAKQQPVAPTKMVIQIMWILIQHPQLGKLLEPKEIELLEAMALQRSEKAKLIIGNLVELCKTVSEDTNFASFQNTLMNSEYASDYEALIKKVFESEFSREEAKTHLYGALKKFEIDLIKKEMLKIAEKIEKNIADKEDIERYRKLGTKLK